MTFLAIGLFLGAGFAACLIAAVMLLASDARRDSGFNAHADAGGDLDGSMAPQDIVDPPSIHSQVDL